MSQRRSVANNFEDEEDTPQTNRSQTTFKRNLIAFWLLGLCNNFLYVVVLSSAKDIIETGSGSQNQTSTSCREKIDHRSCHLISTSAVLLADIIPALLVKLSAPFYVHFFPFELRHLAVVALQGAGLLIVAFSSSVALSLTGVALGSFGSGLGEISYLALASHYDEKVITFWSSGTGGAGILGAAAYALLTEKTLLAFSPKTALLSMLVVPVTFFLTFFFILQLPSTISRLQFFNPQSYFVLPRSRSFNRGSRRSSNDDETLLLAGSGTTYPNREVIGISSLLKYIIPLVVVYFGEYFINQGLTELIEFDCSHGMGLDPAGQYRWYQFAYQFGVFISRSSTRFFTIRTELLGLLAVLQIFNAGLFLFESIEYFIPHIGLIFLLIFYEGLLGGSAYANTFQNIHQEIPLESREHSMAVVSISDTLGIFFAGILAIPIHNWICEKPL